MSFAMVDSTMVSWCPSWVHFSAFFDCNMEKIVDNTMQPFLDYPGLI